MVKLAFLSSTCPEWTFEQMVDAAVKYGYEGVDLRVEWGHNHGLELESSDEARHEARSYAAAQGIAISCIAISARFARATAAERDAAVEQVRQYAVLASALGSPLLRVFGGNLPEGTTMAELRPATAEALGRAAAVAAPFGVTPCLEVHDQHNNPEDVAWIVEHAGHGNVGVVWHPAHHLRLGIPVDDAYAALRPWVRHLHLQDWPKDGLAEGARREFVPIGEGDGHLARVFELLERDGFAGYAANEWIIKRHEERDPDRYLSQAATHLRAWREAAQRAA
ncbi:MAG TPA: sugar phosphate isomerase/epimerase family protein [Chloroflexota bacterium]|jgi:sugar phosphate isomerase/epimerase|nr:sugar phosphate isomerase/epimerase family protein [Chloroflexota bacterium]